MRARILSLLLLLLPSAACYGPDVPNGGLTCAPAGHKPCPDGFHCAFDRTCWRNGQDPPSAGIGGVVGVSPGGGGVAAGAQHQGSIVVGQPIAGSAASSSRGVQFGLAPAAAVK